MDPTKTDPFTASGVSLVGSAARAGTRLPPDRGHGRPRWADLGCGRRPTPGTFGVDLVPLPGVAVVARLGEAHLPFAGASLDRIYALNVLEHLTDLVATMGEIARVLRVGGCCEIEVPYFASVSAHADPTHVRSFTYTTFAHFVAPPGSGWQANRHTWFGAPQFRLASRRLVFGKAHRLLGLSSLANRFPAFYENLLVYWFPARALRTVLVKLPNAAA